MTIVHLVEVTVGATIFRFTSGETDQVHESNTYVPGVFSFDQPQVNQDQPGSTLQIRLATADTAVSNLALAWRTKAPETGDTRVKIFRRTIESTTTTVLFWIGYVVSASYSNDGIVVELLCKSLDNLFTLQGPRKNWGIICNHALFDSGCKLAKASFTQTGTVSSISSDGLIYTVTGITAPIVRHVGGELKKQGGFESRLIVQSVDETSFTVQFPIPEIGVGDTVEISEGCQHNVTDCQAFPNASNPSGTNIENYGGSPFTPPLNIFTKGGDAL